MNNYTNNIKYTIKKKVTYNTNKNGIQEEYNVTILISYLVGLKGCRVGIEGEVVN